MRYVSSASSGGRAGAKREAKAYGSPSSAASRAHRGARPQDPQRYVRARSRNGHHALRPGLRLVQQGLQLEDILREAFGGGWIAA